MAEARQNRTDHVAEGIRQAILAGDYAPNQRLVEADLEEIYSASRRNIRDALARLTHEGLVETIPNKGARVRAVTIEEALDLAEARLAMELLCLERACHRATDKDIVTWRAIAEELRLAVEAGDIEGYTRNSARLFDSYVAVAKQVVVRDILDRLRQQNIRFQSRVSFQKGWLAISLPLRLGIIDGLCDRDPAKAKTNARAHHQAWTDAARKIPQPSGTGLRR